MRTRLTPAGVAFLYAAAAGGWIVLSHLFLVADADPARQGLIEIGKGLLFVLVTSALLYGLVRRRDVQAAREAAMREALEAESGLWMRHFFQLPFIGMAITEPGTGRWILHNDRLCEILGYPKEAMAGLTWMEITHPEDLERDLAELRRTMTGEIDGYQMEKRFVRQDGSVVFTELDVRVVRRAGGEPDYFVSTVQDITERTLARERIGRQARFYAGLSACNAAVARCAGPDDLFDTTCRLAVEMAGFRLAWIGLADEHGVVRVASRYGEGGEYLDGITVTTDAAQQSGRGPTGTAIREGEPVWCDDFLSDPRTAPWHERGRAHGFGASAAVPIRRGGQAVGAIMLYAGHPYAFDLETRRLLVDFAANLSFAMDNFDREAARRDAESAVRSSEERYRLIFSRSRDAILLTAPDGRIFAANDAACRLLQRSEAEVISLGREGLVDPEDPRVRQALEHRARHGEFDGEFTMRRADGSRFEAEVSSTIYLDGRGEERATLIIRDATERHRQQEERAYHASRAETLLALPAAAEAMPEPEFIRDALARVGRLTASRLAWAYRVCDEGRELEWVDCVVASGPVPASLPASARFPVDPDGPWSEALRRRAPVLANAESAPGMPRGALEPSGLERVAIVPVEEGGKVVLLAAVGGRATPYAERDVEALQLVASEAWRIVRVRRARELLGESEARYRTAFATNPDAMTISEMESGRLVAVNEGFTSLFGWREDEAVGRTSDELGLWMDAAGRNRLVAEVTAFGKCRETELRLRAKDGREIRALAVASALEVGGRPCMLAVTRDVTESRRAEETVRKLSLAVEQSPESIVITNLAAEIEYVNQSFLRVTGYAAEDVLGQNPRILQSGRTPKATYDAMWATLAAGEVWKGELHNRRKDGTEYVEFAIIAPIRQAEGRITHYLAVKDDITESKRVAEELNAYRHHLEDLVRDRTEELAEARERAEAANAAKSVFLATMSHEIRTPMNAILGFASLLERDDPRPDQAERIAKLGVAARHLLGLIDDILDLSRIEAGKLSIEERVYDPGGLLAEAADMLRERATAKGLDLAIQRDPRLPAGALGDPLRVRQVLMNLGGNAVKFTERGRVELRAAAVPRDGEAKRLRFEISDTGIGIRDDRQARLFQRFEQADSSTSRRFGGTGLGLAVSKRLVELMGGEIGFDSAEGRGSTFWFEIPLVPCREPVAPARAGASAARDTPGLRILVVDDDDANREIATDLLSGMGHQVLAVGDGAKALDAAAGNRFDVVLMDVQMPVMDGLEATRSLRLMPAYRHTPILAMTASVLEADRRRCLASGMSDFLMKPVDPARLESTLARWASFVSASAGDPGASGGDAETEGDSRLAAKLAGIEGLDAEAGLGRLRGQVGKYARLLRSFAVRHAADASALRASIAAREYGDAARLAHQVKGAAAMIGATAVSEAAAALEAALSAGVTARDEIAPLVDRFERTRAGLAEGLANAMPAVDFTGEVPVDPARLASVTAELADLLEHSDIRAGSLLRKERSLLRSAYGEAAREIESRLEAFDFAAALDRLREVAAPARGTS